ncbi:HepT-like ribonuclease domain-containing protein [Algoriphagus aquaeductus]|nr:HepT-like ribonuclease domain-containing protein [Algoriphagus aquaeductus]
MRNILAHAYDAIEPTTLWKINIKDLPILKDEIGKIKG